MHCTQISIYEVSLEGKECCIKHIFDRQGPKVWGYFSAPMQFVLSSFFIGFLNVCLVSQAIRQYH